MKDNWEERVSCATACKACGKELGRKDQRILSVYDHQVLCLDCKQKEEGKPDYQDVSKAMIGSCMADTEIQYSDPGGYCFHHFYPYTC